MGEGSEAPIAATLRALADRMLGEPARPFPLRRQRELLIAELDAGPPVRLIRMGVGQRHRHVQVVRAGLERGTE